MFGMDSFFKSAEAGFKIAQIGMENMFKMMELFAGLLCQKKKASKIEDPISKKTTYAPQPPVDANLQSENSEKAEAASTVKKKPSSKKKSSTAIDKVQAFMAQQKQGASAEDIVKATGFNKKKVHDILYKLKKRGILKSEKGNYVHL
jgi:predicted Rossmann fold nucleotide-binding protein DprA/Smf involved in DNA uptake